MINIAFDVGVSNLAYSVSDNGLITYGNVSNIGISMISQSRNILNIIDIIYERFPPNLVRSFSIEKQVSFTPRNPYNQGTLFSK
jgi:hypothetical protein